jgi:hypothetical protein
VWRAFAAAYLPDWRVIILGRLECAEDAVDGRGEKIRNQLALLTQTIASEYKKRIVKVSVAQ